MSETPRIDVSYCTDPLFKLNVLKKITSEKCDVCWMAENNSVRYGEFIEKRCFTNRKLRVHYFCLLSGTYISQHGSSDVGIAGFRLRDIINSYGEYREKCCVYCRHPSAAVECAHPGCGRRFHYICGYNNSCLTQFIGQHLSYCHQHIPAELCQPINTKDRDCDICLIELPQVTDADFNPLAVIRTRCNDECPNGLMHRECVQQSAFKAGYDFKCPVCWSENFRTHAAERGIFIPPREAAWEREPGAFKDLQKRKCTAVPCALAQGQNEKRPNDMIGCKICGGQIRHKVCAGVADEDDYLCDACKNQSFANII